jgi:hypothetical protein
VGASTFIIQPWHLEGVNRPASWFFHVKICIERMPLHAWSAEDVKQVLGDVCMFDHMESDTFRRRNTEVFTFYAWMANPDHLPRAKTATFFFEPAGRSSPGNGPPPAGTRPPAPPAGVDIPILIHLAQYNKGAPQPSTPSSPDLSGFASSTGSTLDRPFLFIKTFSWTPARGPQRPSWCATSSDVASLPWAAGTRSSRRRPGR